MTPSRPRGGQAGRDQPHRDGGQANRSQRRGTAAGRNGRDGRDGRDRKGRGRPAAPPYDEDGVRLQKILAEAGLASRRAAEDMIMAGRVRVDGVRVRELGLKVDPTRRRVEVDGMPIETDPGKLTLALNKPPGVVSTMDDPQDRPTLAGLVESRTERLFHVGRLDRDSEGLILLTNDGALANALSHPSHEVPKTYLATVEGRVGPGVGKRLRQGIELEDGPAAVDSFRVVDAIPGYTQVELTLHSGRNRVVRRLLAAVGHPVTGLARVRIGPIALGDLKSGRWRVLGATELASLKKAAGL
ncbi:MAG: rRNA pseudouridine synthase [Bifidobacteriaceae bacterium]|jgi:23S rRNA pseudouridine2605 synthase|nr:rRNA pseudouridine synthase [Bifidobacteriaceae bacterium]